MAATDEYLENQVLTASPHRLHLMVVDGAIRFARQGLEALNEERWEAVRWSLSKARNCVSELIGSVNSAAAPELAERTKELFLFSYRNLALAEIERTPGRIDDALRILAIHRETWQELGLKLQAGVASANTQLPTLRSIIPDPHLSAGRSWVT